jgi:site-specific DNA-methyltransferase (adenine-specific)
VNPTVTYHVGDARKVLATLPEGSVDCVLSSVPYLALRSYLPPGHPDKALEMGSESTPGEWCDALLDVVDECRRVLASHGSLVLECGDTMSGSGGAGGDYNADGLREGQARFDGSASKAYGTGAAPRPARDRWRGPGDAWPADKSHAMAPEILRFALAYGFNPLTQRQTPRWRVRNVVRHCRPNPPVGALSDSWRRATSDYLVACVGRKRYFDLDAVRNKPSANTHARTARGVQTQARTGKSASSERGNFATMDEEHKSGGAPPLDWFDELDTDRFPTDAWVVPNSGSNLAHYAMFNPAILVHFIECMVPRRVCTVCGEPSRRIAETTNAVGHAMGSRAWRHSPEEGGHSGEINGKISSAPTAQRQTLGWSECDCPGDKWRPGVVLDPWAGTGTVGQVAHGHGRSAVLVDLDERNVELARTRLGMFLEVA